MLYITYIDPKTKKEVSTQVVRSLTVGRGREVDVHLAGASVSRYHALVIPRIDGRLEVRDLASTAGTFIFQRGEKRRLMAQPGPAGADKGRATLADGESFFAGEHEIKVHYKEVLGEPTFQETYSVEEEEVTNY